MTIDLSISIGNIVTILTFTVGFVSLFMRLGSMQLKLDLMWTVFAREHGINGHDGSPKIFSHLGDLQS